MNPNPPLLNEEELRLLRNKYRQLFNEAIKQFRKNGPIIKLTFPKDSQIIKYTDFEYKHTFSVDAIRNNHLIITVNSMERRNPEGFTIEEDNALWEEVYVILEKFWHEYSILLGCEGVLFNTLIDIHNRRNTFNLEFPNYRYKSSFTHLLYKPFRIEEKQFFNFSGGYLSPKITEPIYAFFKCLTSLEEAMKKTPTIIFNEVGRQTIKEGFKSESNFRNLYSEAFEFNYCNEDFFLYFGKTPGDEKFDCITIEFRDREENEIIHLPVDAVSLISAFNEIRERNQLINVIDPPFVHYRDFVYYGFSNTPRESLSTIYSITLNHFDDWLELDTYFSHRSSNDSNFKVDKVINLTENNKQLHIQILKTSYQTESYFFALVLKEEGYKHEKTYEYKDFNILYEESELMPYVTRFLLGNSN